MEHASHGEDASSKGDRRQDDRRKEDLPFDGGDRREGQRRSGSDRRKAKRTA